MMPWWMIFGIAMATGVPCWGRAALLVYRGRKRHLDGVVAKKKGNHYMAMSGFNDNVDMCLQSLIWSIGGYVIPILAYLLLS